MMRYKAKIKRNAIFILTIITVLILLATAYYAAHPFTDDPADYKTASGSINYDKIARRLDATPYQVADLQNQKTIIVRHKVEKYQVEYSIEVGPEILADFVARTGDHQEAYIRIIADTSLHPTTTDLYYDGSKFFGVCKYIQEGSGLPVYNKFEFSDLSAVYSGSLWYYVLADQTFSTFDDLMRILSSSDLYEYYSAHVLFACSG
ncbi:hypothetical protein LI291_09820 [Intestinibacillus massiliensis]|uniref:hypothetical protein n=1 Tax=Intestinibacillus massiliensis TaxID=1871029 RepID=UPI00117A915A|nr:hypothetical protein [Intestinibacillus massiliensis]MCB6366468.1 hypothetical protein [Intestinibacillus massiliensis]